MHFGAQGVQIGFRVAHIDAVDPDFPTSRSSLIDGAISGLPSGRPAPPPPHPPAPRSTIAAHAKFMKTNDGTFTNEWLVFPRRAPLATPARRAGAALRAARVVRRRAGTPSSSDLPGIVPWQTSDSRLSSWLGKRHQRRQLPAVSARPCRTCLRTVCCCAWSCCSCAGVLWAAREVSDCVAYPGCTWA